MYENRINNFKDDAMKPIILMTVLIGCSSLQKDIDQLPSSEKVEINRIKVHYQAGKKFFDNKEFKEGKAQFDACIGLYHKIDEETGAEHITAGDCYKQLGWYWRQFKKYDLAHAFHIKRLNLMQKYGTPAIIHDSFLSLDMDAYYLKDLKLSKTYLEQSIEVGKKIKNNMTRSRSLAMSYHSLAGTLSRLKDFSNAVGSAHDALDYWMEYEQISKSHKEHRVVWAFYNIASVYEKWAKHLKKQNKHYNPEKNEAIRYYQLTEERGRIHGLLLDDLDKFEEGINRMREL